MCPTCTHDPRNSDRYLPDVSGSVLSEDALERIIVAFTEGACQGRRQLWEEHYKSPTYVKHCPHCGKPMKKSKDVYLYVCPDIGKRPVSAELTVQNETGERGKNSGEEREHGKKDYPIPGSEE